MSTLAHTTNKNSLFLAILVCFGSFCPTRPMVDQEVGKFGIIGLGLAASMSVFTARYMYNNGSYLYKNHLESTVKPLQEKVSHNTPSVIKTPCKHFYNGCKVSYNFVKDNPSVPLTFLGMCGLAYAAGGANNLVSSVKSGAACVSKEGISQTAKDVANSDPVTNFSWKWGLTFLPLFNKYIVPVDHSMNIVTKLYSGYNWLFPQPLSKLMTVIQPNDPVLSGLDIVGGPDSEINNIVSLVKHGGKWKRNNKILEPNQNILLYGPAGNGKTENAKYLAKHAGVTFVKVSVESIADQYQYSGAANLKRVFDEIDRLSKFGKVVAFFDEIDSVTKKRGNSTGNSNDGAGALQAILNRIGGFSNNTNVCFVAATNEEKLIDSAVISRFANQVHITNPNAELRKKLFNNFISKLNYEDTKSTIEKNTLEELAKNTEGCSIREIKEGVNTVAIHAVTSNSSQILKLLTKFFKDSAQKEKSNLTPKKQLEQFLNETSISQMNNGKKAKFIELLEQTSPYKYGNKHFAKVALTKESVEVLVTYLNTEVFTKNPIEYKKQTSHEEKKETNQNNNEESKKEEE